MDLAVCPHVGSCDAYNLWRCVPHVPPCAPMGGDCVSVSQLRPTGSVLGFSAALRAAMVVPRAAGEPGPPAVPPPPRALPESGAWRCGGGERGRRTGLSTGRSEWEGCLQQQRSTSEHATPSTLCGWLGLLAFTACCCVKPAVSKTRQHWPYCVCRCRCTACGFPFGLPDPTHCSPESTGQVPCTGPCVGATGWAAPRVCSGVGRALLPGEEALRGQQGELALQAPCATPCTMHHHCSTRLIAASHLCAWHLIRARYNARPPAAATCRLTAVRP